VLFSPVNFSGIYLILKIHFLKEHDVSVAMEVEQWKIIRNVCSVSCCCRSGLVGKTHHKIKEGKRIQCGVVYNKICELIWSNGCYLLLEWFTGEGFDRAFTLEFTRNNNTFQKQLNSSSTISLSLCVQF
jgi:hypothetical protein